VGPAPVTERILILASAGDCAALRLPERLSRPEVMVLTPADLSRPGWCYRPGAERSELVAGGKALGSERIAAVVTRLAWVPELELAHIDPGDRAYVAAEMGAFLLAWLSELRCPVANRPGPSCLCGPFWRHERWIALAAGLGLAVEPARRAVASAGAAVPHPAYANGGIAITVVGDRCFGDAEPALLDGALRLARATGVETLTVSFSDRTQGGRLIAASPWPRLDDDDVAQALVEHLVRESIPARVQR
jgi:hypothetical protein